MVSEDWLKLIVAETRDFNSRLGDHCAAGAEARARKHSEAKHHPSFKEGDIVLLQSRASRSFRVPLNRASAIELDDSQTDSRAATDNLLVTNVPRGLRCGYQ